VSDITSELENQQAGNIKGGFQGRKSSTLYKIFIKNRKKVVLTSRLASGLNGRKDVK